MTTQLAEDRAVKKVVQLLPDGLIGFAEIGKQLKDPKARAYFLRQSSIRRSFEHLKAYARIIREVDGPIRFSMHRTWRDVEAHL